MNIQQNFNAALNLGAIMMRGSVVGMAAEEGKRLEARDIAQKDYDLKKAHEATEKAYGDYYVSQNLMDQKLTGHNIRRQHLGLEGSSTYKNNLGFNTEVRDYIKYTDAYHKALSTESALDPDNLELTNKLKLLNANMGQGSHYDNIKQEFARQEDIEVQKKEKAIKKALASAGMAADDARNSRGAVAEQMKILEGGRK